MQLFRFFLIPLLLIGLILSSCGTPPKEDRDPESAAPSQSATVSPLPLSSPKTAPPVTSAASMALYDMGSGTFLAQTNAAEQRPMASTTKIMTGLVVLEHCNMEDVITVPPAAVGVEGSSVYLYAGEQISVRTLLYALLLSSANDAAETLALHTAGSIAAFADLMNAKAAELGLSDTHFENPHGLPASGHYTTARDLALITAAAMRHPVFREIVSTKRYSVPQEGTDATRLFLNHNRLLQSYNGAIGVKTGFTRASGRCLVSAAEREGLCLVAVTLNDGNDWRDHAALFDWGFENYTAFTTDAEQLEMPVVGGVSAAVPLVAGATVTLTLPADHPTVTKTVYAPAFIYNQCRAGEEIGYAVYRCGDTELARIPLVAGQDVECAKISLSLWQKFLRLVGR